VIFAISIVTCARAVGGAKNASKPPKAASMRFDMAWLSRSVIPAPYAEDSTPALKASGGFSACAKKRCGGHVTERTDKPFVAAQVASILRGSE
jgi:hypothetical protein